MTTETNSNDERVAALEKKLADTIKGLSEYIEHMKQMQLDRVHYLEARIEALEVLSTQLLWLALFHVDECKRKDLMLDFSVGMETVLPSAKLPPFAQRIAIAAHEHLTRTALKMMDEV